MKIHELVARAMQATPDARAIRDVDGREASYAAHWQAITDTAALLQEHGLKADDRLMIAAENCHATAVLIFAASLAGAVAVPVNARMSKPEIARITTHASPRLIAYTTGFSTDATRHAQAAGARDFSLGFGAFALSAPLPVSGDDATADTAVILYTTGTTGDPKGVMLTHGNLCFAGDASAKLRNIRGQDLVYGVLPMTHVFGLASMLMATSTSGAAMQLESRFQPDRLYAALKAGATIFPGVPQMHALLMSYVTDQGLAGLGDVPLHYVSSGGAPLDPAWKRKAEAFYGLPLQNGYGLTETTAGVSATKNPLGSTDISCGPPLPGVEIMLDTDVPAATDPGVGEVLTRGPHVMAGYFRNAQATSDAMQDGWLRTGDLGRIDDTGALHIVGRAKELIIRGGFNVYPPEVEAAFNDHAAVVQCAVVGRSLPGGDEEVLAFVQCADPKTLDTNELRTFVAARLTGYKRPNRIIAAATLPAAPSGKILKHKLIAVFADQLS